MKETRITTTIFKDNGAKTVIDTIYMEHQTYANNYVMLVKNDGTETVLKDEITYGQIFDIIIEHHELIKEFE